MRIFLILFFLIINASFADMIILKNKQVLIGRYISEDERKIKFQTFNETKTINKSEIINLELGYSGVPVCYQLQNKWSQVCGDVIHFLDKNKMILGKGDALLEKEEFLLKDLRLISLKKSRKEDKIFYILRQGLPVTVRTNGNSITGEVQSITHDSLTLKTPKESLIFNEIEIDEVSWQAPEKMKFSLSFLRYSVPGLFQFQEGRRFKGFLLGFLFFGFAGAIGVEYSAAQNALSADMDYILVGESIYVGSNLLPNKQYQGHLRGMTAAIAGITLVSLFHSYEVYSFVSSKGVKASIHMQMPSIGSQVYRADLEQGRGISSGIEFRISYSF